jgi:hypothetical protein
MLTTVSGGFFFKFLCLSSVFIVPEVFCSSYRLETEETDFFKHFCLDPLSQSIKKTSALGKDKSPKDLFSYLQNPKET